MFKFKANILYLYKFCLSMKRKNIHNSLWQKSEAAFTVSTKKVAYLASKGFYSAQNISITHAWNYTIINSLICIEHCQFLTSLLTWENSPRNKKWTSKYFWSNVFACSVQLTNIKHLLYTKEYAPLVGNTKIHKTFFYSSSQYRATS